MLLHGDFDVYDADDLDNGSENDLDNNVGDHGFNNDNA
jgi:hypothetical protein